MPNRAVTPTPDMPPSKTERNTIRFAVGSPTTAGSWLWRLWVNKNDVYLGTRDKLQAFKVSLHASDVWRIAFVEGLARPDQKSDRVIVKWRRPSELAPGLTIAIGVLISSIEPVRPMNRPAIHDSRIKWLWPPSATKKLFCSVWLSKPSLSESRFRAAMAPADLLVGCIAKMNGEHVWLVVREDGLTSEETAKIKDVMYNTKIHLRAGASEEAVAGARALLVVSEDLPSATTPPTILDIPLGKENLEIPSE